MPVAEAKKVRVGQVWSEKGKTRFVRVESTTRAKATCVERYSPVGRFSSLAVEIPLAALRAKYVLCRDAS